MLLVMLVALIENATAPKLSMVLGANFRLWAALVGAGSPGLVRITLPVCIVAHGEPVRSVIAGVMLAACHSFPPPWSGSVRYRVIPGGSRPGGSNRRDIRRQWSSSADGGCGVGAFCSAAIPF